MMFLGKPLEKVYSAQYLRGIAALVVVLSHWTNLHMGGERLQHLLKLSFQPPTVSGSFISDWMIAWKALVYKTWVFNIGFSSGGVLLFFLISGFVIAISVERQGWIEFAMKRFLRLMPVLWATMLLWVALNYILHALDMANHNPFDLRTLLANAFLISDWLWTGFYDLALWTLHVEVKFYVLMACLILIAQKISIQSIFGLAAFITALSIPVTQIGGLDGFAELYKIAGSENGPSWPFYSFSIIGTNAPYLVYMLIGSLVFLWYGDRITLGQCLCSSAALLSIFATLQMIAPNGIAQFYFVEDGLRAFLLFFGSIWLEKNMSKAFTPLAFLSGPLNFLGSISYPLYLVHGLIGMTIISVLHLKTGNINLAIVITGIVVFPLSWLLHRYIEIPSQSLSKVIAQAIKGGGALVVDRKVRTTQ